MMDKKRFRTNTLIYDHDCDLCRWTQNMVSKWDRKRRIHFLAFQDPLFSQWFPEYNDEDPPKAMLFIDQRERIWEGFEAFRQMLPSLAFGKLLFALFHLPGVPRLANCIYEWVAKNRYRFQ